MYYALFDPPPAASAIETLVRRLDARLSRILHYCQHKFDKHCSNWDTASIERFARETERVAIQIHQESQKELQKAGVDLPLVAERAVLLGRHAEWVEGVLRRKVGLRSFSATVVMDYLRAGLVPHEETQRVIGSLKSPD